MDPRVILAPFIAMMLLTLAVWVYMYYRRIPFILKSKLTPAQMTAAELARLSPPAVANPSDNLKNLFEIPTLFYALVLFIYQTGQVDTTYVVLSWAFVVLRSFHSAVHCTVNIILLRFWIYVASTLVIWLMVLRSAIYLLN